MKLFFLLLLVGLSTGCVDNTFNACRYNLGHYIGLNDTVIPSMFTDYTVMYNYFLYTFSSNPGTTNGMINICNGLELFNGCMTNQKDCLGPQNLMKRTDIYNAFFITGTLLMYTFNCGPGMNTLFHEGLPCAQSVMLYKMNVLQACVNTYQSSITHDQPNACTYAQNLMNCWSAPFATSSCRRAQSADVWWACEANRIFTTSQYPNCNLSCDLKFGNPSSALSQYYLDTHYKVVDGVQWHKIPDYMDKIDGKVQLVDGPWMQGIQNV